MDRGHMATSRHGRMAKSFRRGSKLSGPLHCFNDAKLKLKPSIKKKEQTFYVECVRFAFQSEFQK